MRHLIFSLLLFVSTSAVANDSLPFGLRLGVVVEQDDSPVLQGLFDAGFEYVQPEVFLIPAAEMDKFTEDSIVYETKKLRREEAALPQKANQLRFKRYGDRVNFEVTISLTFYENKVSRIEYNGPLSTFSADHAVQLKTAEKIIRNSILSQWNTRVGANSLTFSDDEAVAFIQREKRFRLYAESPFDDPIRNSVSFNLNQRSNGVHLNLIATDKAAYNQTSQDYNAWRQKVADEAKKRFQAQNADAAGKSQAIEGF